METKYVKECSETCGMRWEEIPEYATVNEVGTWWVCPKCNSMKCIKAANLDQIIADLRNQGAV